MAANGIEHVMVKLFAKLRFVISVECSFQVISLNLDLTIIGPTECACCEIM